MPRLPVTVAAFSFAAINAIAISGPDSIQVAPTIDPSTISRAAMGMVLCLAVAGFGCFLFNLSEPTDTDSKQ